MKSRFTKTVLLAAVIFTGIWVLSNRDQIREPADVVNLIQKQISSIPVGFTSGSADNPSGSFTGANSFNGASNSPVRQAPKFVTGVIRVASFRLNEHVTGRESTHMIDIVADICRRYDAIAFQEINGEDNTWLSRLTERMNKMGAVGSINSPNPGGAQNRSDYFYVSDRPHSRGRQTQSAIVFNRQTLDLDLSNRYTVNDPDKILEHEPLVGWFRARGSKTPEQAFTFTLVNVKIDARRPETELAYLGELFRAIRNDGRNEDDVVIVGDFDAGDRELQPMRKRAGMTWVVSSRPTNSRLISQFGNSSQFDNLVL